MKKWLSYIISVTIACLCYSCTAGEELPGTDSNGNDEGIVIRLGITSRADGSTVSGDGGKHITSLKVWMVHEQDERFSFYKEINDPGGIAFDEEDIYRFTMEISVVKPGDYGFYILANSDNLSNADEFNKNTRPSDLKAAYFTRISGGNTSQAESAIPMYGDYHSVTILSDKHDYEVQVPLVRVLSKLELFFAKKNSTSSLAINDVAITNVPDRGFIVPQNPLNISKWDNRLELSLSNDEDGIITGIASDFTNYDSYTSLNLSSPFLFENPEGCLNNDISQSGNNNGYQLIVNYTLNGRASTQIIYLTEITRNTIYKIYGLVGDKDADTQFILVPQKWTLNEENIDFTDVVTYSVTGWDKSTCDLNETKHELVLKNDESNAVAYIDFQVQAPIGAQWLVTLTNTVDFELVGNVSGDVSGNTIRVGVKARDFYSEVYHETQLRVYAIAGGRSIELDMTKKNVSEQKPEKEVNHYTIIQSF